MSRRQRNTRQIARDYDFGEPHNGYTLDFVNKIFVAKPKGGAAKWYSTFEEFSTFTRGGVDHRFINKQGIIENASVNTLRYEYNPSTFEPRGAIFEPQKINICLQSQTFDSATWVKTNTTISANAATDPENASNADQLIEDLVGPLSFTLGQSISFTTANAYSYSVWVKPSGRSWVYIELPATAFTAAARTYFDVTNGVIGTTSGSVAQNFIEAYPNGWYRIAIRKTSTATTSGDILVGLADADNSPSYLGDGASGVYLWGAQVEAVSNSPTSYILTTTGSVTRSADSATITIGPAFAPVQEGSFYTEAMLDTRGVVANIAILPGIGFNFAVLTSNNFLSSSDSTTIVATSTSFTGGVFFKFSHSYGPGIGALVRKVTMDGNNLISGTFDGSMYNGAVATSQVVGDTGGSPSPIKVCTRRVDYWPTVLNSAYLYSLTSKAINS